MVTESNENAFIGWKSEDGKLEVIGIGGKDKYGVQQFKIVCTECNRDTELFPLGYFISTRPSLEKGHKPCACSNRYVWSLEQYLITAERISKKRNFIIHGIYGEYKKAHTKLKCECVIDGHVWTPTLNNLTSKNSGCPKCSNNGRPTEEQALNICKELCDKEGYTDVVFPNGYSNATNTRLEYKCPIHGLQNTSYVSFVNGGKRCKECGVIKSRENQKIPAHEALNNCKIICDVLGYRPIGFVDGYINAITTEFEYECPIHGIQKVRYNKFVNSGNRCPSCSVSGYSVEKPGSFYVVRWTRGVHSFIKFGITNQSIKDRISQQARYTEYSHEIIYSQTWEDGKIAAILERRIKYNSTLNIGVIDKQYFEDGFTETIDLKELDILLEYVRIYLAEFHKGEIMEKKSALDIQIDGQHYKNQKIQPIELAYKLGGTPAFCKLAKYLTREKNDKKVNLQKAYHCICLEEDLKFWANYHYEYEMIDHAIIEDNEQLIIDFSNGVYEIQQALFEMFFRDYSKAKYWVNQYALKAVGEEVGD